MNASAIPHIYVWEWNTYTIICNNNNEIHMCHIRHHIFTTFVTEWMIYSARKCIFINWTIPFIAKKYEKHSLKSGDDGGMRVFRFHTMEFVVVLCICFVGCMMRCLILLMIYFRVLFYVNFWCFADWMLVGERGIFICEYVHFTLPTSV